MSQYIRRFGAPLALSCAMVFAACSKGDDNDGGLATDSTLNRDLELANRDTAAQPALTDVPAGTTNRPATSQTTRSGTSGTSTRTTTTRTTTTNTASPAPRTTSSGNTVTRNTGGGGSVGTIASGSEIGFRASQKVCTNTNRVGDRITATVAETVVGSNGATIPAGSTAVFQVTELKRSENTGDPVRIGLTLVSVRVSGTTYQMSGTTTSAQVDQNRQTTRGKDAQKVATGAAIGAIAGQVLGKDTKSTVIGGAVGAAAGAAVASQTANFAGCVNEGGAIRVRLNESAQIRA